jgi:hypothetical protein
MKSLELFIPMLLPYVYGAGDPAMLHALRQTCIEFCKSTDVIQRVTPMNITATVQDYTVTPPTDMSFCRIQGVGWQGKWLDFAAPSDVDSDTALTGVTIGTAVPETGDPRLFFQKTPTSAAFSIFPIPDTTLANGMTLKASFYPTQTALTVDDVLYDDYAETIACGAAVRLMSTPGQLYTSTNTSVPAELYRRGVATATRQAVFGKLPVEARVHPVAFII